jgi:hypothetical protein
MDVLQEQMAEMPQQMDLPFLQVAVLCLPFLLQAL